MWQKQSGYHTLLIFIVAACALWLVTHLLIPFCSGMTNTEPILWWFLLGGSGVFLPLLLCGFWLLRREGFQWSRITWTERLRFRRMTAKDWAWGIGGILLIGLANTLILAMFHALGVTLDPTPPFMRFEPLTPERYWLLAVWLPYWLLNIFGEEIVWRGVIFPRQEAAFGRYAWLVQAVGWSLFHIAFGWQLFVSLLPILCILPYTVQRQKNSWIGVLMHAGLNGPAFLAIAFGLL